MIFTIRNNLKLSQRCILLLFVICFISFIFPQLSWTQSSKSDHYDNYVTKAIEVKKQQLTPEQAINRWRIGDLQLSPNDKRIAMVVTEPIKGTKRISNIWAYDLSREELLHFTISKKSDRHPRWSPDGKTLAFLSGREETTQIYLIPSNGGEAKALTKSKTNITSFCWSPDGSQIAFLSEDAKTEEEEKKQKEKDDAFAIDYDQKDPRLRIIDIETGEVKTLTPEKLRIAEFLWTPNGEQIIISATDYPRRDMDSNKLYSITISNNDMREMETPAGLFAYLKISHDGKTLAYIGARTEDGPQPHDLYIRPLPGGEARNLTGSAIDRPIMNYIVQKDGSFIVLAATGFTNALYKVAQNAAIKKLKEFKVHPSRSFAASPEVLAFVGENTMQAPEVWISTEPGQARKITHFNKHWDNIPLMQPEIFQYPSFDGMKIEAALLKPAAYKKGIHVPLIVLVHGGPAGRFADSFHSWSQLLAAQGFAVLLPNIRGSIGYGHDFIISNRYDWGGNDWKDVMAGVDYMIEQGIADAKHLGIGGWSYGGYMAAWAITQTDRFKASVSGAPMTDLASEFGTEGNMINPLDTWALGTPYENLDLFIKQSPVTFIKNVKTPTLLLCGEKDVVDPIGQCQQFYRGLRRYNVETKFIVYPRMGHGPQEEKHQLDILKRMINWFEKYVK
jgi:dipeptidyl aminopeptidase/acylaminoacyl peptidase